MKKCLTLLLALCLFCSVSVGLAAESNPEGSVLVPDLYAFAGGRIQEPARDTLESHFYQVYQGDGLDLVLLNAYVETLLAQSPDWKLSHVAEGASVYRYFLEYTGSGAIGEPVQLPGSYPGNLVLSYNGEEISIRSSQGIEFADLGIYNTAEDTDQLLAVQDLASFSNGILAEPIIETSGEQIACYWLELEDVDTAELVEAYAQVLGETWKNLHGHADGSIAYLFEYDGNLLIGEEVSSLHDFEENLVILYEENFIRITASTGIRFADLGLRY